MLVPDATEEEPLLRKNGGLPGAGQDLGQLASKRCEVIFAGWNEVGLWGRAEAQKRVILIANNILYVALTGR